MTKKEIIVMGDIEMGGGTLTDDFISDKALAKLINSLTKKNHPVDLILNGDTFDFLKCPYIVNNKNLYPRHITSDISLAKLRLIYNAHSEVFEALKNFVTNKENKLFFIIGNHDHDLFHKEVQFEIRNLLRNHNNNIYFPFKYRQYGVYAEHGHQYDFVNKVNLDYPFLKYHGENILNIPWVAYGYITYCSLKEEHPILERIIPKPTLFSHHKSILKKVNLKIFEYFFKGLFYYPIRYFYDPTYTFPKEIIREFYRRVKNVHWDVDEIIETFKRKKKRSLHKNKIHVLGHVHVIQVEKMKNTIIIHPDTWRDEYHLNVKTRELIPKVKKYLQVLVSEDENLTWNLVEVPINREILHFDDVIRDEKKYVQQAADEENFKLNVNQM